MTSQHDVTHDVDLTSAEADRAAELAELSLDDYVCAVEDYLVELAQSDRRVFWSERLAERTLHALDELARVYNAMLTTPGEVAAEARPKFNQLIARASAHRKALNQAIKQHRLDAASMRRRIGRIVGEIHHETRGRVAQLLKEGRADAEVKALLLAERTTRQSADRADNAGT